MACFGGGNRVENRELGLLGETARSAIKRDVESMITLQYGMDIFTTQLTLKS